MTETNGTTSAVESDEPSGEHTVHYHIRVTGDEWDHEQFREQIAHRDAAGIYDSAVIEDE